MQVMQSTSVVSLVNLLKDLNRNIELFILLERKFTLGQLVNNEKIY